METVELSWLRPYENNPRRNDEAAEAVAAVKGIGSVEVKLVWEPAWTFERMSDDAKMMFEMF